MRLGGCRCGGSGWDGCAPSARTSQSMLAVMRECVHADCAHQLLRTTAHRDGGAPVPHADVPAGRPRSAETTSFPESPLPVLELPAGELLAVHANQIGVPSYV